MHTPRQGNGIFTHLDKAHGIFTDLGKVHGCLPGRFDLKTALFP